MANILLDIPDRLSWASGASRIVDPVTAGYTLATGYDYSQRPPPKTENYFRDHQYTLQDMIITKTVSSFRDHTSSAHAAVPMTSILRDPGTGIWLLGSNGVNVYYSHDGLYWSAAVARPHAPFQSDHGIVTNTDGFVNSTVAAFLNYSADGITWNSIAATANSYLANRGSDDFFIEVEATPNVWIWATGITGGRVAATTPPAALGTTPTVCGGDAQTDWYITNGTAAYTSTDSADTWAATGGSLSGVANPFGADYHNGTWVVVGHDGANNAAIDYSTDEGLNWTSSTFNSMAFAGSTILIDVKALGNNIWVACGWDGTVGYTISPNIMISIDDGVNWYPAAADTSAGANNMLSIFCDGARVAVSGESGTVSMTDPLSLV